QPDLAVIDVRMPPTFTDEGVRAAALIRQQDPGVKLLVLSQYVEERYASELIADSPHGLGYVLKDRVADVDDFLSVVADVGAGGTWLDPEVVQQIFVRSRRRRTLETLTPREREVLSLMAQGRSNQAIADTLFVSAGSVEKHISSLLTKLDLPPVDGENRRVMAVLRYLESEERWAPPSRPSRGSRRPSGRPRRSSRLPRGTRSSSPVGACPPRTPGTGPGACWSRSSAARPCSWWCWPWRRCPPRPGSPGAATPRSPRSRSSAARAR